MLPADAGLDVLLGNVRLRSLEHAAQRREHRFEDRLDGDDVVVDTEVLGEHAGVLFALRRVVARRHGDPDDLAAAERVGGDSGDERRVYAAGETDEHTFEAVLGHVVAGAHHQCAVDLLRLGERRGDGGLDWLAP